MHKNDRSIPRGNEVDWINGCPVSVLALNVCACRQMRNKNILLFWCMDLWIIFRFCSARMICDDCFESHVNEFKSSDKHFEDPYRTYQNKNKHNFDDRQDFSLVAQIHKREGSAKKDIILVIYFTLFFVVIKKQEERKKEKIWKFYLFKLVRSSGT